jgi:hypothetical protein
MFLRETGRFQVDGLNRLVNLLEANTALQRKLLIARDNLEISERKLRAANLKKTSSCHDDGVGSH